jgi:hypothetical protein
MAAVETTGYVFEYWDICRNRACRTRQIMYDDAKRERGQPQLAKISDALLNLRHDRAALQQKKVHELRANFSDDELRELLKILREGLKQKMQN